MVNIDYKDTISIVETTLSSDGYATEIIKSLNEVSALFITAIGQQQGGHQNSITSTAEVYIDPTNEFVMNNYFRLEGMLIIANPFGDDTAASWYRIDQVTIGQDKLLSNQIDNISCALSKSTEIKYVS